MDENHSWTILVVSQDKSIQKAVTEAVGETESKVISADSVKQFFEELGKGCIDLIIYDPDIHALDGRDAFSLAKAWFANVPSIMVFEQERYEVTRSMLDKGGVVYRMLKPVSTDELKAIYDGIRRSKIKGNGG